jgi:hypothetical protein
MRLWTAVSFHNSKRQLDNSKSQLNNAKKHRAASSPQMGYAINTDTNPNGQSCCYNRS